MSFFRSAQDVSDSGDVSISQPSPDNDDDEEDYSISRVKTIGSNTVASTEVSTSDAFSPSSAPASFHTQGLLHSLLEERCMYQAMAELQKNGVRVESINDPKVRALGHRNYLRVSRSLGGLGVIKQGFDSQHYSPLRQNYLDGLDLLSQQTSAPSRPQMQKAVSQMDLALPETFRKYIAATRDMHEVDRQLNMMTIAEKPPEIDMPSHPLLDDTKYAREFDEFSMLGKGGYGIVFHVKHKLDGGSYAIKKIPMGSHRIRRIQQHGQVEMDEILLELRTLARLSHPNVVRYHTGWIEYATFASKRAASSTKGLKLLEAPDDSTNIHDEAPSIDVQFVFDDDLSGPGHNTRPDASAAINIDRSELAEDIQYRTSNEYHQSGSLNSQTASYSDNVLERMRSRNTLASVSDEEVELIPRHESPTSTSRSGISSLSDGEAPSSLEPCLALHIQMSLYSMTLADFLAPSDGDINSSTISSLRHCFHPSASLCLLLSIIDGVRYLHKEGIVHRDLKPGNIFLAVRPGIDCPPGAIDLSSCGECRAGAKVRPFNMDVCIGDFGLVSTITRTEDQVSAAAPSRIVGTEIYRPETITRDNHPSLDVFALGIITFELFFRFGTRMERHETLHKLRKGEFPRDFEDQVHCEGLAHFIGSMVSASEKSCPSWESLRAGAVRLLGRCKS